MTQAKPLLSNFRPIRPEFETSQEKTQEWLLHLHVEAEKRKSSLSEEATKKFHDELKEKWDRVGCKPKDIAKRGHEISDSQHENWDEMEIYNLKISPQGVDLGVRTRKFEKLVDKVFERIYKDELAAPTDLFHVTCTGYVSPSAAQKICSAKGWGQEVSVTHAYHMGCYASVPTIRMGIGSLYQRELKAEGARVDIVHTELSSLHTNPLSHALDQLVSQSLFADGYIAYCLTLPKELKASGLRVLAIQDEIIPNSAEAMSWTMVHWGAAIVLGKEIPILIRKALRNFLERLAASVNRSLASLLKNSLFAIHPGGPKILDQIQELLGLEDEQMRYSRQILYRYGNMPSATLPHIWKEILDQEKGPCDIVSLAFGPGLTIFGAVLEKEI